MTEVEQFIRDAVRVTGEPVLFPPPDGRYPLLAIPLWKYFTDQDEGIYVLALGPEVPETEEDWYWALKIAHDTVRRWTTTWVAEVHFIQFETALGSEVRRVEASALGLSVLQLELNRAGSQIVLRLHP